MTEALPRFSSLTEIEEWEEKRRNAPPMMRVATLEDMYDPGSEQRRIENHIRCEKERLERQEEERLKALIAVRDVMAYSEAIAHELVERISAGEFLVTICNDENMPTMRRCNQWMRENIDFQGAYKDAIERRLDIFEDQLITICDDASKDFRLVNKRGKQVRVFDPEAILRSKLRVEARRWHLKAYRPAKWGETSTLNVREADAFDPQNMTEDELNKTIAEIEKKSGIVKRVKVAA